MSQAESAPPAPPAGRARLAYIDTLRVIAVATVFLFHSFRPFNLTTWLVMNDRTSPVAIAFEALVGPWGMPFFFVLSGAGTWLALRRRTPGQVARERVTRLLVPYFLGCLLLTPVQGYFDWQSSRLREASPRPFLQFMLDRYQGANPTVFDWLGYHLWFLAFLFCLTLIALPLFRWLRGDAGRRRVESLAGWVSAHRGGLLLFLLPLLLVEMGLRPLAPQAYGWSDFVYYLCFFTIGALLVSDERLGRAVRRDWVPALAVAVVAFLGLGAIVALGNSESWMVDPAQPGFYLFWGVSCIYAWCAIVVMWFVGLRFLDVTSRFLAYAQQAIVPFYVLHQAVIVAVSFYVVRWPVGVTVKMLVVFFVSLAITLAIVELLVRRVAPLRALFGMKASPPPEPVVPSRVHV